MAEHTILQDSGYYIDISEIEAIKLGIPSHFYYASINHLETINEQIKTSIKKGSKISLINIKDTISKRKANINNKPSFSRGIYDPEVGIGGLTSSNCRIDSLFATHRSSESFIGTLVASIFTENWDPKIIFGSITTEAISPNFTDREYRTIENESRYYHFRLKVKPTSLDRSYIITYLSYPCTSSDAHWYNFLIGPPQ